MTKKQLQILIGYRFKCGSNIITILRIVYDAVEYRMESKEGVYRFAKDRKSFIDEFEKQLKITYIEKKMENIW